MPIDLRSDTVTKPDKGMREAMASARVGDDVFGEDPTAEELETSVADLFGKKAALFVPSGTMGNQIAVNVHTIPGQEVILEADSHIMNYELAAMSALSGVIPRPVVGNQGALATEQIEAVIRPKQYYVAQTGLITLENTHNMAGGTLFPQDEAESIIQFARDANLPIHLDGARIFNAAAATGRTVKELTEGFDSIMFCFSKGLGAPIGSMLLGSTELIARARVVRKRFGGGMRQVGILAAAALYALEHNLSELATDHENASELAQGLAKIEHITIDLGSVQTNIVIFSVDETSMDSITFLERLAATGVLAVPVDQRRVRMVTHRDVSGNDIEQAIEAVKKVVQS